MKIALIEDLVCTITKQHNLSHLLFTINYYYTNSIDEVIEMEEI